MNTISGWIKFKEVFQGFDANYVLIGGVACTVLLNELGIDFRPTKDFDIVIIIEEIEHTFFNRFWKFIDDGKYSCFKNSDQSQQFYRFDQPKEAGYPKIIELFCRKTMNLSSERLKHITPMHINNSIMSLSAIVLDDEYYFLIKDRRSIIDGISVLNLELIIVLKMKAWLDLKKNKLNGVNIHADEINKHRRDVFRLLGNLDPKIKLASLSETIKNDIKNFMFDANNCKPFLNEYGIKTSINEFNNLVQKVYL